MSILRDALFLLPQNCTKLALPLHCGGASFFIQLSQKEGITMYDNDWICDLQLDDDLFPVEEDVDRIPAESDR